MMSLKFFKGLFSSQGDPIVKAEEQSEEIGLRGTDEHMKGAEDVREPEGEGEANQTDWEGFGDEDVGAGEVADATILAEKPKKKKKKKKKKLKRDDIASLEEQVQISQGGDDFPKADSPFDVVGSANSNGHVEDVSMQDEGTMDDMPVPMKRYREINGSALKRKRSSKLNGIVLPEDLATEDAREKLEENRIQAASENGAIQGKLVGSAYPVAIEPEQVGNEPLEVLGGEGAHQDLPMSNPSIPPQESKKKGKKRKSQIIDESSTKLHEDDGNSVASYHVPSTIASTPFADSQHDTPDENMLDAAAQLQKDAGSLSVPEYEEIEEEVEEPRRISKKARGKRKAIDEPLVQGSTKSLKRRKTLEPQGQDIRRFGFLALEEQSSGRRTSTTSSQSPTLKENAHKGWEEYNRIAPEPELPPTLRSNVKSPPSSWNAVNAPVSTSVEHPVEPSVESVLERQAELEVDAEANAGINAETNAGAGAEVEESLFVPNETVPERSEPEESTYNASGNKSTRPVVEVWAASSTPSMKKPARESFKSELKTPKTPKTPKQKALSSREGPAIVTTKGKLPAHEIEAISAAVESYRELKNLSDFQLNGRIQADAKDPFAQIMWKEICDEVPHIPRRTVMNNCRRRYYNVKRGSWTDEDDEELRSTYEKNPGKWTIIGEIINRFPEDVRDRWRNYVVCAGVQRKDAWEIEEEHRLRAAIKQCIEETREKSNFGDDEISDEETLIDWGKVSKIMSGTRSRIQCRDKWTSIKDRENITVTDPADRMPISETWRMDEAALQARLFSAEEKLTLLRAIRDTGAAREGKIPWKTISSDLNGKGKRMAWKYCTRKLKERVPGHKDMDFKDIIAHLVQVFETAAPAEPSGFDLPVEIFPSSQQTPKNKRRKRAREENVEDELPKSTKKSRKSKQAHADNGTDDTPAATSSTKKRTLRDRMLKNGDTQETATSVARSESAEDVVAEVAEGFESIKRTPKRKGKYLIRKSKRNSNLSEEKVVEDPSDDDQPPANEANGGEMESPREENNTVKMAVHGFEPDLSRDENVNADAGVPEEETGLNHDLPEGDDTAPLVPGQDDVDDVDNSVQSEVEENVGVRQDEDGSLEHHNVDDDDFTEHSDIEEDVGMRQVLEDSPDLDTPIKGRSFFKNVLGSPIQMSGLYANEDDATTSDGEMSDIPAVKRTRRESVEL